MIARRYKKNMQKKTLICIKVFALIFFLLFTKQIIT